MNEQLKQLIANVVSRLDNQGDLPLTHADLANILEQEAYQMEVSLR
jgi:hypothetical protein